MINTVSILGIEFSKLTLEETISLIEYQIENNKNKTYHIITVNPEIAIQIKEDDELKNISNEADLITPDGIGIVWASRLQRNPIKERVTGYDLLLESLRLGNEKEWSFYFLGSVEEVSKKMVQYVEENFSNVKILGRHNGYFDKEEESNIINEIQTLRPDILIVALGSPLADKFIHKHKEKITAKVTFGVGGSMDVITGKVKRTPTIWKRLNLEWLHRRMIMPSRKERQKKLKIFAYRAFKEAIRINKN